MARATSETRAEVYLARELLETRGWSAARPPRGNVIWKNEYRDYPNLLEALAHASKTGDSAGYPDFIVLDQVSFRPLIVGEAKASVDDIGLAIAEANLYADALASSEINVLAAGVAGDGDNEMAVRVHKRVGRAWREVEFRGQPIQWLPTFDETNLLLADPSLFSLDPRVPSPEILAQRGEEINRIFRECDIKDEYRPVVIAAFMLALAQTHGDISSNPETVLIQVNHACRRAFTAANKVTIADSIMVPEANIALAHEAGRICRILRLLGVTTLTAAHDYLGQLYETFFRFTGGNTIGQYFTPRHVTKFMTDLCNVTDADVVLDPACGTGGFLISSLYRMMGDRHLTQIQVREFVEDRLVGFESEPITAALCVANMILRGDGTTGVINGNCFTDRDFPIDQASVALGNPPFPHKSTDEPPEDFVDRALEGLRTRGLLAMVLPASLAAKAEKKKWRERTLQHNSLRAVISLPDELFQPYASATTNIVVLEKGVRHDAGREVFFARIANDGFKLKKNVRVVTPGEQLTDALAAWQNHGSSPGEWAWARLEHGEWSPGAYISSATADESDTRREIEGLLRAEASFHAQYADKLAEFRGTLDSGGVSARRYSIMTRRRALPEGQERDTLAYNFLIYYGQKELHSKEHLLPGSSLVISSSGANNGCYGFFDFENLIRPPFATVPSTGSIGMSFVQHWPCGVTDDCLILIPREGVPLEALYIAAAVVRLERWRFNYGRKATPKRIAGFKLPITDELINWIRARRSETERLSNSIIASFTGDTEAAARFSALAEEWRSSLTRGADVTDDLYSPNYQQIIGMGGRAVPFILGELERDSDHWFWALQSITGTNPIPPEAEGNVEKMAEAWLDWGRKQGYKW